MDPERYEEVKAEVTRIFEGCGDLTQLPPEAQGGYHMVTLFVLEVARRVGDKCGEDAVNAYNFYMGQVVQGEEFESARLGKPWETKKGESRPAWDEGAPVLSNEELFQEIRKTLSKE